MRYFELLKLLRIKQYSKNLFCLIPVFFGCELYNSQSLQTSVWAFLTFCIASSSVYIINDLTDLKQDKKHSLNRFRPLAKGTVSRTAACVFCAFLIILSFLCAGALGKSAIYVIAEYLILNLLYCFILKKVFLADILCISLGFELRAYLGCIAINHQMTFFLFIGVLLLCTMLVLSKRLYEKSITSPRRVLKRYSLKFCQTFIQLTAVLLDFVWVLYTFYGEPVAKMSDNASLLFKTTSVITTAAIYRYVSLSFKNRTGYQLGCILCQDLILGLCTVFMVLLCYLSLYS